MEVFIFLLKLINPCEKSPTLPVGQKTLWAPLQRICWQRQEPCPSKKLNCGYPAHSPSLDWIPADDSWFSPFKAYWLRNAPAGLTLNNCTLCPHCIYVFCIISEQTATCATHNINWLVFITEMKSVYCAAETGSLNKAVCVASLKGLRQCSCSDYMAS